MNNKYIDDCYNRDYHIEYSDHDDPRMVNIFHIANISLPSNPLNRVEVIIRDHDDISLPCFYILNEDRSKELYKVSLFDNSYTKGLSKEDKVWINEFIRKYSTFVNMYIFSNMRADWLLSNMGDYDETPYDNITKPPYYE